MTETTAPQNNETTSRKSAKQPPARRKRNYVGELAKVEARVATALHVLKKCEGKPVEVCGSLISAAMEILMGE